MAFSSPSARFAFFRPRLHVFYMRGIGWVQSADLGMTMPWPITITIITRGSKRLAKHGTSIPVGAVCSFLGLCLPARVFGMPQGEHILFSVGVIGVGLSPAATYLLQRISL